MWFLPAQFYVTSLSNDEPLAGANYLGFYLDFRRLQEAIARDEVEIYTTADDEAYVSIRGDWEALFEGRQSRLDIEDNAFRPLVGYIRTTAYPCIDRIELNVQQEQVQSEFEPRRVKELLQ